MSDLFYFTFPAIRGIQANREYYVSMCPMKLIPKMFVFDDVDLPPKMRSQRILNKARIPEMASYMTENPDSYTFSAITVSIDGEVEFSPLYDHPDYYNIGTIKIPMTSRFIINDGQHRRAAIEAALKEKPDLGNETISVVFYIDIGLQNSQQMFSDLNRYAVRPTKSLNVLYDYRDPLSQIVKSLIEEVPVFKTMVEVEKSTISNRSRKIFTLSSIYNATKNLLKGIFSQEGTNQDYQEQINIAKTFWIKVSTIIKEWQATKDGKISPLELRKEFLHSHSLALIALGKAGNTLIKEKPKSWEQDLQKLEKVNWKRSNKKVWEGRATTGGRVSNSIYNQTLVTNYLKMVLDLPLNQEEKKYEKSINEEDDTIEE